MLKISFQFGKFIKEKTAGEVLHAPLDVILDKDNVVQPDILFVSKSNYEVLRDENIQGAPNLVVEIWLPEETEKYRNSKKSLYQKNGITEFWQIHPTKKQIQIDVLDERKNYQSYSEVRENGCIKSKVLTDLEMEVNEIFE